MRSSDHALKGIVDRRTLRPWSGTLRRELPFARTVTFLICADLAIANAARSSESQRCRRQNVDGDAVLVERLEADFEMAIAGRDRHRLIDRRAQAVRQLLSRRPAG